MADIDKRINQLSNKLDFLLRQQSDFSEAIQELQTEINQLKINQLKENAAIKTEEEFIETVPDDSIPVIPEKEPVYKPLPRTKSNVEKFIGENLISKIGIVILVIGVAIGAKYANGMRIFTLSSFSTEL